MRPNVLMLGLYDPRDYARGRVLYRALQKRTSVRFAGGPGKFWSMFRQLIGRNFDIALVTGKPALILAWMTRWWHRRKILFDVFISDFDTLVMDRKFVKPNSLRAKLYWWLDRFCCRRADFNFLDTEAHVEYFVDEFGLPTTMFGVVPIGADETVFFPRQGRITQDHFTVEWHGTYIPLQGVEVIVQAAKLLESAHIQFKLIGSGQMLPQIRNFANRLNVRNIVFVEPLAPEGVAQAVAEADLCLGIFGTTGKAQRVLANKCYEVLAMGKPLITARTVCTEHMIEHGAALVESGNAQELADAILTLRRDGSARQQLGASGRKLFVEQFSTEKIADRLLQYILQLLPNARTEDARSSVFPLPMPSIRLNARKEQVHSHQPAEPESELQTEDQQPIARPAPKRQSHLQRAAAVPSRSEPKILQKLDDLFAQAKVPRVRVAKQRKSLLANSPFPRPGPLPFMKKRKRKQA